MATQAKKLHDLLEKILATTANSNESVGRVLSNISKDITGTKDGGATLLMIVANFLDQIEKDLKTIPDIEDYHLSNYKKLFNSAKKLIAPNTMALNWAQFTEVCKSEHILSNLINLDFLLSQKTSKTISPSDINKISEELSEIKSLLDAVDLPKYANVLLRLELEKLEIVLRSDLLWNEREFFTLYASLGAQIIATADLFRSEPEKTKSAVSKIFARVRGMLSPTADVAQLTDATNKVITYMAGGSSGT